MLKEVGGTVIQPKHRATCHCGAVELEVGCLEGVNPFAIPHVPTNDGVNHPSDRRKD